ncbi:MAG: hypothetical protein ACYCPR_04855 [Thermoplasmataceae archaeon]|jgi:hypothetical protein
MIQYDKFGKLIYPGAFYKLQRIGDSLEHLGFRESIRKPNLFSRRDGTRITFADMRGTKKVPIWEDPCPLIYVRNEETTPSWKVTRKRKEISKELSEAGIPHRFSYYIESEPQGLDCLKAHHEKTFQDDLFTLFYNIYQESPDGYCHVCEKDFSDDLYFCSKECETIAAEQYFSGIIAKSKKCEICGIRELDPYDIEFTKYLLRNDVAYVPNLVVHHTSYFPELGIEICKSCHSKIHHSNDPKLNNYKPPDGDSKEFYMRRKTLRKLKGKYCKITWKAEEFNPLIFFRELTFYKFNVMRKEAGILPKERQNRDSAKYQVNIDEAIENIRCEKCGFVFKPQHRTTCPKCRCFFR